MIYTFNETVKNGDKITFIANGDVARYKEFSIDIVCLVNEYYRYDNVIYKCKVATIKDLEFDETKFIKLEQGYISKGVINTGSPSTKFKIDSNSNVITGLNEYPISNTEVRSIEIVGGLNDMILVVFGES